MLIQDKNNLTKKRLGGIYFKKKYLSDIKGRSTSAVYEGVGTRRGIPFHIPISTYLRTFVLFTFLSTKNHGYSVHMVITMP